MNVQSGLLFVFSFIISGYARPEWTTLIVKFTTTAGNGFYRLPLNLPTALQQGYVITSVEPNLSVVCKPNDGRVCILYDNKGTVCGLDVGLHKADVTGKGIPYNYDSQPLLSLVNRNFQDMYITRIYFVEQEILQSGGRTDTSGGVATGIWLRDGGYITYVPDNEADIESDTFFVRENCVKAMGRHYYYNIYEDSSCYDFEPIFLLTNFATGVVHGVGWQLFGNSTTGSFSWYESIPPYVIKPTVPTAPQCMTDIAAQFGIASLHIYFVENPWLLACA